MELDQTHNGLIDISSQHNSVWYCYTHAHVPQYIWTTHRSRSWQLFMWLVCTVSPWGIPSCSVVRPQLRSVLDRPSHGGWEHRTCGGHGAFQTHCGAGLPCELVALWLSMYMYVHCSVASIVFPLLLCWWALPTQCNVNSIVWGCTLTVCVYSWM